MKLVLTLVLIILSLVSGGCATGPKYVNARQQDSACIAGVVGYYQGSEDGSCNVNIILVDDLVANFEASYPGVHWQLFTYSTKPLYLSPGKHTIMLGISEMDDVVGTGGDNETGVVGTNSAGCRPTITEDFRANHLYRFTANWLGKWIALTLWDITNGEKGRLQVADWTFDSNGEYLDNTLPIGR